MRYNWVFILSLLWSSLSFAFYCLHKHEKQCWQNFALVIFIYGGSMMANAECRRKFRGLGIIIAHYHMPNWWVAWDFSHVYSFWIWWRGVRLSHSLVFHQPKPVLAKLLVTDSSFSLHLWWSWASPFLFGTWPCMAVGWPPLQVLQLNLLSQVLALRFGFIGCKHPKQYFFFDEKLNLSSKAMSMNFTQPSNWWFSPQFMVISQLNHQFFPLILIHMLQPFLILFSCQFQFQFPFYTSFQK